MGQNRRSPEVLSNLSHFVILSYGLRSFRARFLTGILNESTVKVSIFSTSGEKGGKKKNKNKKQKKQHTITTLLGASQLKTDICLKYFFQNSQYDWGYYKSFFLHTLNYNSFPRNLFSFSYLFSKTGFLRRGKKAVCDHMESSDHHRFSLEVPIYLSFTNANQSV